MIYKVETIKDGTEKYFFIRNLETMSIEELPSKYLMHKIKCKRSPNTVKRTAFSICYYMKYMAEKEMELTEVYQLDYEKQTEHFVEFLYWLKAGNHTEQTAGEKKCPNEGTCNAYLKDVFRFYLFIEAEYEQYGSLKTLSYAPFFVKDYSEYYKGRCYHKRSLNSNDGWNSIGCMSFMNQPILKYSNEIRSAVLIVHGEKAHSYYFGRKDEADLQEAFEKNELRNGCPILINKKRIKGSDVIMREFYTEIPEKIWDKRKNEIADSMNIHYVKKDKPFSHGKKANGRRIVMYSGVGREDPERGEIYDEQF